MSKILESAARALAVACVEEKSTTKLVGTREERMCERYGFACEDERERVREKGSEK